VEGMPELREFTRITRHLSVRVKMAGLVFVAETENISLRGLLLVSADRPALQSPCYCEILLDPDNDELSVRAHAHVVRHTHDGVALCFDELIGMESYVVLRNLLMYNAADPERIEQECAAHVGLLKAPASGNPGASDSGPP
jgi:hypothetical protein